MFTSRSLACPSSGKTSVLIPVPRQALGSHLPHRAAGGHDKSIKEIAKLLRKGPFVPHSSWVRAMRVRCASGPAPVLPSRREGNEKGMQTGTLLHSTNGRETICKKQESFPEAFCYRLFTSIHQWRGIAFPSAPLCPSFPVPPCL